MKYFLTISLLTLVSFGFAQKFVRDGESIERIYRDENDSSRNFYLVLEPTEAPKGLIMLLPGYGAFPGAYLYGSPLPYQARKAGYVVIIPPFGFETFYINDKDMTDLESLVGEVMTRFNIPKNKFILGGHSAGGNAALLYASRSFQLPEGELIRPAGVFGIDPPLDMERFRNTVVHEVQINYRKDDIADMKIFLAEFESMFGGSPEERPDEYGRFSGYSRSAIDGGNSKYLGSVPIRLYCDPDVNWALENIGVGYEHLNASDIAECVAQLKRLGNDKAEMITNVGKGILPGGVRNPHAPDQFDIDEFLQWVGITLE